MMGLPAVGRQQRSDALYLDRHPGADAPGRIAGYCPADLKPERNNEARAQFFGLIYPGGGMRRALTTATDRCAAVGRRLEMAAQIPPGDPMRRQFHNYDRYPSEMLWPRTLAGPAFTT